MRRRTACVLLHLTDVVRDQVIPECYEETARIWAFAKAGRFYVPPSRAAWELRLKLRDMLSSEVIGTEGMFRES